MVTNSLLMSFAVAAAGGKTKDRYTLVQILTIIKLREKKATLVDIAAAVGHPKNSVQYKMLWIGKKVKAFGDEAIAEIYKEFDQVAPESQEDLLEDVNAKVEEFLQAAG